jgi:hypothetical protein
LDVYIFTSESDVYHYTLMDRNMWATERYNQDYNNQNEASYGYYYQRWNNYGFPTTWTLEENWIVKGWKVSKSEWYANWPSKYSRNVWSYPHSWRVDSNGSIWWWSAYEKLETLVLTWREWPCPEW